MMMMMIGTATYGTRAIQVNYDNDDDNDDDDDDDDDDHSSVTNDQTYFCSKFIA